MAAVTGGSGLVLYLAAHALGADLTVVPSTLETYGGRLRRPGRQDGLIFARLYRR
ncbi:hypothetical protein [Actinomadura fibrosa]|uniref:Uncharacterized protein n=1 Tax=Actinomadura fibrosa TaxID=111802 RepID=A0ABW2XUY6_9ACTN|nr:hypothetical protein [Actinomadura fibrosa]